MSPSAGHRATATAETSLEAALSRVGDRWALLVVDALLGGPRRFSELSSTMGGIASNVLSQRLKHLEHQGVLRAQAYSLRPPRFRYELTAAGHDLAGALRLLGHWGARQSVAAGADATATDPVRHGACGTAMEARWYCPTCSRSVDDDEAGELHFL